MGMPSVRKNGICRLLLLLACLLVPAGLPLLIVTPAGTVAQADNVTVIEAPADDVVADPKGDQTLRLLGPNIGPETLDPAMSRDLSTAFFVRQVFRGLTRLDRNLN